ncbi:MAG: carboxypeptidase-like regulatory domain-containing protein [Planctomycetes bacterium]|nr:carboxypeptidase-like regulatory domain-containing protein [Planctomycetota bacterium]
MSKQAKTISLSAKRRFFLSLFFLTAAVVPVLLFWDLYDRRPRPLAASYPRLTYWEVQSIDTMKYSRDLAREKAGETAFDEVIDDTIRRIAAAGATHAAVGTPYDEEFFPFLERWVTTARKYNLRVWFRGNWCGWEGWFNYPPLTAEEHIARTGAFILAHPDIFAAGDIFTACPECENGLLGDPRITGETEAFRRFLLEEQAAVSNAFAAIGRSVRSNLASMNGDVARLVMDKDTTAGLGGVVTVDHYVATPAELISDLKELQAHSGGMIVLGEFGVPIPGINGDMDDREKADWIRDALLKITAEKSIIGLNYWLSTGATTELWSGDGVLRPVYYVLESFFKPSAWRGLVKDELGRPVSGAEIASGQQIATSSANGYFAVFRPGAANETFTVKAPGYLDYTAEANNPNSLATVMLIRENPSAWYNLRKGIKKVNDRLYRYFAR